MVDKVELELCNPRGEIEPLPVYAPSPRIADLNNKVIGLYSNSKHGMDNFYTAFAELLKKNYPTATSLYLAGPYEITDKDLKEFAPKIDAFVNGVGD